MLGKSWQSLNVRLWIGSWKCNLHIWTDLIYVAGCWVRICGIERKQFFFHEGRKEYRHYNFLVKCSDGTTTLFFAETCPCCKEDSGIYLCCPLEENDNGSIYTNISRFFVKTWQDNYILFRRLLFFFIRHALMPSPFPPFSGKCFGCQKCGVELLLTISVAIGISVLYSQI